MTTHMEDKGLFYRLRSLVRGVFSSWLQRREHRSPHAVYEQAIEERKNQYEELKRAVAGILYMRNKLEAEIRERSDEQTRAQDLIRRAVERGDDEVALELITQKDHLVDDLERARRELEEVATEVETAKGNLIKFRGEIRSLERERVRMMATLANVRARRRFQQIIEGLSVDGEMKARDGVREHIARLKTEGHLDQEMDDSALQARIRDLHREARHEGARKELEELKRRLRPQVLTVSEKEKEPVFEAAH